MDDTRSDSDRRILTIPAHRSEHTGQLEISQPRTPANEAPSSSPAGTGEEDSTTGRGGLAAEGRRASQLLKELGEEFVRLRAENRTAAWAAYQRKIASNLNILVPFAIGLKDVTSLLRELEEFMKTDAGASVATPSEVIRSWLNSENTTVTMRSN
jgi:hypothetical protein